ncbi:serine protease 28-like [Paramormyrops kingsleyae]|uniref:Serine protease 28-like n=1 Tax=Paramormyrops kingsleyae TaxID=1676925 RepID=A0A3B3R6A4_9TELE|nr:serine protease 28-like [Paramormyrops kingsleyae]
MPALVLVCVILLLDVTTVSSLPRLRSSIIGGQRAAKGRWPWMAQVYVAKTADFGTDCGGSLINEKWVLSAASCFKPNFIKEDSLVRLGAYWLSMESDHELQFGLRKVIIHPNYAESSKGDNIALIRLDGAVAAFTFVEPVTLPSPTDVFDKSSDCWIAGWGMTGENVLLKEPGVLQEAKVPIVPDEKCKRCFNNLLPNMVCAGGKGKLAWEGDIGGPLVCQSGKQWIQVGIASFGILTPDNKICTTSFYTRVSSYMDFINNNTRLTAG